MTARGELPLAGKLTIRAGGRKVVLAKHARESERHVVLKALVFALYVPSYPNLAVEQPIGSRYKPDLVAMDPEGNVSFWAECGETSGKKIADLVRSLPGVHLVFAKQVTRVDPYATLLREAVVGPRRTAPVELLNFPPDAADWIAKDGTVHVSSSDITVVNGCGPVSASPEKQQH
jgi:hypothetical protein